MGRKETLRAKRLWKKLLPPIKGCRIRLTKDVSFIGRELDPFLKRKGTCGIVTRNYRKEDTEIIWVRFDDDSEMDFVMESSVAEVI